MNEWGDAKSRYQEEILRKKESLVYGSNFKARAFSRQSKSCQRAVFELDELENINPLDKSDGSSLMSDSELEEIEAQEMLF